MRMNRISIFFVFITLLTLQACDSVADFLPSVEQPTPVPEILVMTTFQVQLPSTLPAGESVFLAEVDEVTGLAFNQTLHPMEAVDNLNFALLLPIKRNFQI